MSKVLKCKVVTIGPINGEKSIIRHEDGSILYASPVAPKSCRFFWVKAYGAEPREVNYMVMPAFGNRNMISWSLPSDSELPPEIPELGELPAYIEIYAPELRPSLSLNWLGRALMKFITAA